MLNENQQKWVDALRSGEFRQAKAWLEANGGFCCLGVACVVAEREGVTVHRQQGIYLRPLRGRDLMAQPEVKRWLGLKEVRGQSKDISLTRLNDAEGYDFEQIADFIEAHAEELFE